MVSDDAFLKKQCKENEVDYEIAKKLKAMIFPLLEGAHKKLRYQFDETFVEQRKGMDIRLANSGIIRLILRKLIPQPFSMRERIIISLHLEYLSLIEGFFATQVNFLVFTLIANGHDLYSTFKGKYVYSLGDIEEVNLTSKLKFLRRHDFGIVANKVNVKLRNSVAHLFYYIDKKGAIKFGNQMITKKGYEKLYDDLRNLSFGLHLVTRTYYRRFA